jgi:hypothetical protein
MQFLEGSQSSVWLSQEPPLTENLLEGNIVLTYALTETSIIGLKNKSHIFTVIITYLYRDFLLDI